MWTRQIIYILLLFKLSVLSLRFIILTKPVQQYLLYHQSTETADYLYSIILLISYIRNQMNRWISLEAGLKR